MHALVLRGHGDVDQYELRSDWPIQEPEEGEVMVNVKACGLNYLDIFVRRGMPGLKVDMPRIPGGDIAGTVTSVGEGVSKDWVGKRVLIDPYVRGHGAMGEHADGGLCEYVTVPAANLIPLPANVTFEAAASLPIAYGTAQRMMITRGGVRKDELVLILGASGGVGTGCVQIAKEVGCKVIACASSSEKLSRLAELGADYGINYLESDFSTEAWSISRKQGVDVVINFTGGDTWQPSVRALRRNGRILTCGATDGYEVSLDLRYVWEREISVIGSDGWERQDLIDLVGKVSAGRITPVIDRVVPLELAVQGFRALEDRDVFGKVIVTV